MLLDALLREELNAKRRRDLKLRIKTDFIIKLGITRRTGFGYVHKKQHHARCNKPTDSYDTYAPFWNGNKFDLRRGTSTEWPDLLRGPGPFSLPCELGVELLAGLFGLGRHFPLFLALPLASLARPAIARLEMSFRLPTYTLVVLVVAALLLPDLTCPFGIPLLVVDLPLVAWVDL